MTHLFRIIFVLDGFRLAVHRRLWADPDGQNMRWLLNVKICSILKILFILRNHKNVFLRFTISLETISGRLIEKIFQAATFAFLIFLIDEILADFDLGQLYNMCLMSKILTASETHNWCL